MNSTADTFARAKSIVETLEKRASAIAGAAKPFEGNPNLLSLPWPTYGARPPVGMTPPNLGFGHSLGQTFRGLGNYAMGGAAAATVGTGGRHGLIENLGEAGMDAASRMMHGRSPGMAVPNAIKGTWRGYMDQMHLNGYDDQAGGLSQWSGRNVAPAYRGLKQWWNAPARQTVQEYQY